MRASNTSSMAKDRGASKDSVTSVKSDHDSSDEDREPVLVPPTPAALGLPAASKSTNIGNLFAEAQILRETRRRLRKRDRTASGSSGGSGGGGGGGGGSGIMPVNGNGNGSLIGASGDPLALDDGQYVRAAAGVLLALYVALLIHGIVNAR